MSLREALEKLKKSKFRDPSLKKGKGLRLSCGTDLYLRFSIKNGRLEGKYYTEYLSLSLFLERVFEEISGKEVGAGLKILEEILNKEEEKTKRNALEKIKERLQALINEPPREGG